MEINSKVNHWVELAEMDIPVMEHLFEAGDYHYSLFIGHLILEKILKAHFIKKNFETPPRTHDLTRLASQTGLEFKEQQIKFLIIANSFNIEARYPEEKLSFYKTCKKNLLWKTFKKLRTCSHG